MLFEDSVICCYYTFNRVTAFYGFYYCLFCNGRGSFLLYPIQAIMIAGVVTIIMAVIMKNSSGAAMAAVGAVILAAVVTLVYAHKVYTIRKY